MRFLLLITIALITRPVFSQSYECKIFEYVKGYHSGFTMEGVTVEPGKLIVHTKHHNKFQTRTVNIPPTIMLYIPSIFKQIPLTVVNGAGIGVNTFKSNKRYDIDFVFNLDWFDLIEYADNPIYARDILSMRLTTDPEFIDQTNRYGVDEWRFDFRLPLNYEQQLALGAGAYLSKQLVKGEFETTAAFTERTQPDLLRKVVSGKLGRLIGTIIRFDMSKIEKLKPVLTYNADAGVFDVVYGTTLTKNVQIKVPIEQAKEVKDGYASGKYVIRIGSLRPSTDGSLLILALNVQDSKDRFKTSIFDNEYAASQPANLQWLFEKTINELIKKHPQGKLLKL